MRGLRCTLWVFGKTPSSLARLLPQSTTLNGRLLLRATTASALQSSLPGVDALAAALLRDLPLAPAAEQACLALAAAAGTGACMSAAVPALVSALLEHKKVEGVVVSACAALSAIASGSALGNDACVAAGAVPAAAAALKRALLQQGPQGNAAAAAACRALAAFTGSAAGVVACAEARGAATLAAALRAHGAPPALAQHACTALHGLAVVAAHRMAWPVRPLHPGTARLLGDALWTHARHAGVVGSASAMLQALAQLGPSRRKSIESSGVVASLVAAYSTQRAAALAATAAPADRAAAGAAADAADDALGALGFTTGGVKAERLDLGSLAPCATSRDVVCQMRGAERVAERVAAGAAGAAGAEAAPLPWAESSASRVVAECLGVLTRLAPRERALSAGMATAVAAAVRQHGESDARVALCALRVQSAILAAVRLAAPMDGAAVAVASQAAMRDGAWRSNPSHRAVLVACGAVPHLAAAHAALHGEARARAQGALALLGYTGAGERRLGRAAVEMPCAQMTAARVVELVLVGGGDASVAEAGARALSELCQASGSVLLGGSSTGSALRRRSQGDNVRQCMSVGAVPALAAVLQAHAGVAGAARHACLALASISTPRAGRAAGPATTHTVGALPHIAAVLKLHSGDAEVAEAAARALSKGTEGCWSAQRACKAAGAIPPIIAALQAHAGSAAASEWLCRALFNVHHLMDDVGSRRDATRALCAMLQQQGSVEKVADLALGVLHDFLTPSLKLGQAEKSAWILEPCP